MIIFSCDKVNIESHKTASICYGLLTELQDSLPKREKLIYLAQHSAHRCPYITAANVFIVNINALFGIIASLTSNVIVLVTLGK